MTHPIIPPPELVQQWADMLATHTDTEVFSAAAQWGSDRELEACCQWLHCHAVTEFASGDLRAARRPKPPSLKEQALDLLHLSFDRGYLKEEAADTIRRALEQLDD
jgi:hypothetical protein